MPITGNEIATMLMGVHLGLVWHRARPKSDFGNRELEKLQAVNVKLSRFLEEHSAIIATSDGECMFNVEAVLEIAN